MKKKKVKAETIITSHVNADFDAIASMLAAQKLYPGAMVIFPGSQEKNLRDFFISSMSYLFNMADRDDIDLAHVKRLILVDSRQKQRLNVVSEILDKKELKIHIFDHHPPTENDVKGDTEVIRFTGATTTILTAIIREKGLSLTPEEATVMALGIYEDTGNFTYTSTTVEDFKEAGFLLSRGADLNTIASLVAKEISPDQVNWLSALLNEMVCHRINGCDVHLSTISSSGYIPDLASIVQKLMRMEDLDVCFAIVLMGSKITIVARSRISQADVGKILSRLGGGGHPYAASAKIADKTLAQVEQQLLELVKNEVQVTRLASELMSSPAITIRSDVSCKDANRTMTRYNINALLVWKERPDHPDGYITRQVIQKIAYHKLDHLPVTEYMSPDLSAIAPDADLQEIEDKIIAGKQRILPVIGKNKLLGVITRTDLLNYLVQHKNGKLGTPNALSPNGIYAKKRDLNNFIIERLDHKVIKLIELIGRTGAELGVETYVVGGFVRDLLLYRENDDIDIVVEGDGIDFAKRFSAGLNGRCNTHKKFGTAVIILPDGFKIDVASARLEYYKFPAALPTVEMSSIKLDLFRRDFTINTLAICLSPQRFGTLIDFFGAQRDLKDRTIRIIHNLSFVEDPTRVFRAIKFANRFDFTIGRLTSSLIKNAVKLDFFKNLSGLRVFSELKQILEEENPIPAIDTMVTYGLDRVIHHELRLDAAIFRQLEAARKVLAWHDLLFVDATYLRWSVYFMILMKRSPHRVAQEIVSKLKFSPTHRKLILKDRHKADQRLDLLEKSLPMKNSDLHAMLSTFKTELLLYMMATARDEGTQKAISHYYTQLRDVKVVIRGRDLLKLGITPGPAFRKIIQAVLNGRLDGEISNFEEEMAFVQKEISKNKGID